MDEPLFEDLEIVNPAAQKDLIPPPAAGAKPLRDGSFLRTGKDKWAIWARNGVRWDFRLHPDNRLWRQGWEMEPAPHLLCLDDAMIYVSGWEAAHDEAVQKGVRP